MASTVLKSRKSSYAQATEKEIELSHMEAQAYHILYRCQQSCYRSSDSEYYAQLKDLDCDNRCLAQFTKTQRLGSQPTVLSQIAHRKESCMTGCFQAKKGTTDQQYCIEKCGTDYDSDLAKIISQTKDVMLNQ